MLHRAGTVIVAALLGAVSAAGAGGCGDERGKVKFEGDTGETATGTTAGTEAETVGTTERTSTEP